MTDELIIDTSRLPERSAKWSEDTPDFTDTDIAKWLASRHFNGEWVFNNALGWHRWNGSVWEPATVQELRRVITDTLKSAEFEARVQGISTDLLNKWKTRMSNNSIRGTIAQLEAELFVRTTFFNQRPELLNVANGVLDLRTGELSKHDKSLGMRQIVQVPYQHGARHKDWDEALGALSEEQQAVLQVAVGQGITGYSPLDDKLNLLLGPRARNGKSTICLGVHHTFGDYSVFVSERVLVGNSNDHPTEKMQLFGARLAFIEELPSRVLSGKQIKDLTGRHMTARYVRQDNVSWKTTHTLFVTTNHPLEVDYMENAVLQRLRLFLFEFEYTENPIHPDQREKDPTLRERIVEGADGQHEAILAWAVEGSIAWFKNGRKMIPEPQEMAAAREKWARDADVFGAFFDEYLEASPDSYVASVEVLAAFNHYLRARGHAEWRMTQMVAAFESRRELVALRTKVGRPRGSKGRSIPLLPNFSPTMSRQTTCWYGLKFRAEMAPESVRGK